jgi:RNA polymerase sigma-70 factor, ECF subfamily
MSLPARPGNMRSASERELDQALMVRVAGGDAEALGLLFERHSPMLIGLAYRMLRNARDAEDLVQDVFVEAWQRAPSYEADRSQVRTWLVMITRSRSLDRIERQKTQLRAKDFLSIITHEELSIDRQVEARVLRQWLNDLSEDQQEVITRAYFDGLSSTEIAEELAIPVGTVKSRVAAALRELRQKVQAAPVTATDTGAKKDALPGSEEHG